jgi:hypothetical protein
MFQVGRLPKTCTSHHLRLYQGLKQNTQTKREAPGETRTRDLPVRLGCSVLLSYRSGQLAVNRMAPKTAGLKINSNPSSTITAARGLFQLTRGTN